MIVRTNFIDNVVNTKRFYVLTRLELLTCFWGTCFGWNMCCTYKFICSHVFGDDSGKMGGSRFTIVES